MKPATSLLVGLSLLAGASVAGQAEKKAALPKRVRRIVLHCPGNPALERPERRFVFLTPAGTLDLWKPGFGTHWIVWTDGSLWPRHPLSGEPPSELPPVERPDDPTWRAKLAREAAPVYSHLYRGNSNSLGIEVSHSGRSADPFPFAQVRSLAWLLRTLFEMSEGRLGPDAIAGHKDLDRRPAYLAEGCERAGCAVFVDQQGLPYRRRVDPPEALFAALVAHGISVPRGAGEGDRELRRVEALAPDAVPQAKAPGRH